MNAYLPDDILFVARHRCQCGAGIAVPIDDLDGPYRCSSELLGWSEPHMQPKKRVNHAFALEVEVGSATTRPHGLPEEQRAWLMMRMRGAEMTRRLLDIAAPVSLVRVALPDYKALCAWHRIAPHMWEAVGFKVAPDRGVEADTIEIDRSKTG